MKRFCALIISVLSLTTALCVRCSGTHLQLTPSDEELLCRFAVGETGEDSPLVLKLAAISVVLNRLAHSGYPDSVAEIIFSNGGFRSVESGHIDRSFSKDAMESARDALRLALLGKDPTEGALYIAHRSKGCPPFKVSFEAGGYLFG